MAQNNNNNGDVYLGLLTPKTELKYNPVTPVVGFIDSSTGRTGNFNAERSTVGHFGSSTHTAEPAIGSFDPMSAECLIGSLDDGSLTSYLEGLLIGESHGINNITSSGLFNGTDTLSNRFEPITAQDMNRASDSFGSTNYFQWSPPMDVGNGSSSGATSTSTGSSSPDTNWITNMDGHGTSLTELLDLEYHSSDSDGLVTNNLMATSDLISSTYEYGNQFNDLGLNSEPSAQLDLPRQDSPYSQYMFSEPSTSADTASAMFLTSGSGTRSLFQLQPYPIQIPYPYLTNNAFFDMAPRPGFSYPSMAHMKRTSNSSPYLSPTAGSSPSSGGEMYFQVRAHDNPNHYYEVRFVDPMLNQGSNIPLPIVHPQSQQQQLQQQQQPQPQEPQPSMPSMQELMRRMDHSSQPDPGNTITFYNGSQTPLRTVDMTSDRRFSATTHNTKWSHATPSSRSGPGGPTKTIQRRKRQQKPVRRSSLPGTSAPRKGRGGAGSRSGNRVKRPYRHHCPICGKGFKDRYSVRVHVRVHTGAMPFACKWCKRPFRQLAHLQKHHKGKKSCKARPKEGIPEDKNKDKMKK